MSSKPKKELTEKQKKALKDAIAKAKEANQKITPWRVIRFYLLIGCLIGIILLGFSIAAVKLLVHFGVL